MVVVQLSLILPRHVLNDLEVRDIKRLITVLMVLANTTMRPVLLLNGALVLLPSRHTAAAGLPDVDFPTLRAHIFVYAWLFSRVNFTLVFTAEYVFELSA